MQGTEHIMIFTQDRRQSGSQGEVQPGSLECKSQDHRNIAISENAKNERVLMEMQFQGDTSKHILEQ